MLHPNFVILGAVFSFLGVLSYLRSTLKGTTKPNRVTWSLWAIAPLIAFAAELDKGVGIQSLMTFMVGFNPVLVVLVSLKNKKSEWKLGTLDYIMGALSLIGIALWLYLGEGNYAIFFAIVADGLAAVPTLIKSFKFPETENYLGYMGGLSAAFITLLTINVWEFAHYAFPVYILLVNSLLVSLIKFKFGKYISAKIA